MILFFADGRLGNQIFQYAFLKTIALNNEIIFCFNMGEMQETFDIEVKNLYNISNKYMCLAAKKIILPFLRFFARLRLISYIEQRKNVNFRPLPKYLYKKGFFYSIKLVNSDFFQAEVFFDKNIIKKINIKKQYVDEAKFFLSVIPDNFTKVFVHVRRGDYLNEVFIDEVGWDLPNKYFFKAIDIIKNNIDNPFFIFLSDDTDFVEKYFQNIDKKIISKNSMQVDLAIMTLCQAAIISNSSFSWWGAYLMNSRIITIAPKYWVGWKKKIESNIGIQPSFSLVIDFL